MFLGPLTDRSEKVYHGPVTVFSIMMRSAEEGEENITDKERVGDHLDRVPLIVGPGATAHEVMRTMIDRGKWVSVIEEEGEVIGVMVLSDVINLIVRGNDLDQLSVGDFMNACRLSGNRPCIQISIKDSIDDALDVMSTYATNTLLVYDENNKFVGTISAVGALKGWEEKVSKGPSSER